MTLIDAGRMARSVDPDRTVLRLLYLPQHMCLGSNGKFLHTVIQPNCFEEMAICVDPNQTRCGHGLLVSMLPSQFKESRPG